MKDIVELQKRSIPEYSILRNTIMNDKRLSYYFKDHRWHHVDKSFALYDILVEESNFETIAKSFDPDLAEKLDQNPNLVGFENGIIDMTGQECVFRDGTPEDYVSLTTGIEYIPLPTTTN